MPAKRERSAWSKLRPFTCRAVRGGRSLIQARTWGRQYICTVSLISISSPLHTLAPKVWVEDGCLVARTSIASQIFLLGSSSRRVTVDPRADTITVEARNLWALRSEQTIHIRDISHFEYRYGSLATSWDIVGNIHDSLESYSVSASLYDRSEVFLIAFRGAGSANTGVLGVMMGDSLVDYEGDQGATSLSYIDSLQSFTGKGLSRNAKVKRRV